MNQLYKNGQDFAKQVLATLVELEDGFQPEDEQDFNFYLYTDTKADAEKCANNLAELGFDCEVDESDDEDSSSNKNKWLCISSKTLVPTEADLAKIGDIMLSLTESVNGKFDGWELDIFSGMDMEALAETFMDAIFAGAEAEGIDLTNLELGETELEKLGLENLFAEPDMSEIAQSVLSTVQENMSYPHEFIEVTEKDLGNSDYFDHLDMEFYQELETALQDIGFIKIADIEDKTVSNQTHAEVPIITFARAMWHDETKTLAFFFYVEPIDYGFIDFISFSSSEHTIHTTTTPSVNEVMKCDAIDSVFCEDDFATVFDVFALHKTRIGEYLQNNQSEHWQDLDTIQKVMDVNNHSYKIKMETLQKNGWVTKEYLMAQTGGDEAFSVELYEEIQKILAEDLTQGK